jgi:hypothetical protein
MTCLLPLHHQPFRLPLGARCATHRETWQLAPSRIQGSERETHLVATKSMGMTSAESTTSFGGENRVQ